MGKSCESLTADLKLISKEETLSKYQSDRLHAEHSEISFFVQLQKNKMIKIPSPTNQSVIWHFKGVKAKYRMPISW